MNILVVCDYFLDYLGGAQTAIAAEVAALRAAGHTVTVVAPGRHGRAGRVPVPPEQVAWKSRVVLPVLDMAVVTNSRTTRSRLDAIVVERAIDVVHVHSEFGLSAAALKVAADRGIARTHTVHTLYWRSGFRSSRLLARVIRRLHRAATGLDAPRMHLCDNEVDNAMRGLTLAVALSADLVVSPSAHQAEDLRAAGVSRVTAVANCVPPGTSGAARLVASVAGPLRVLWIGRCIPEKRAAEFAEAASLACEIVGPGALEVTLAGDGPLLPRIRAIARRSPGIRVLGRVASSQVAALLADHHVSALTSLGYDNQPMTVAESVAALRGVVYVDARLREGLDSAGIFVDDASVEGMAAALVLLAHDPRPVEQASARAIAAREVFSATVHASALEEAYRAAMLQNQPNSMVLAS
ncbi:MAG TPA: glycosyltransferase family 4 protein [Galbitalea sp.]|jgi:glycosyltransferase involved in cell wall biosynthesis